MHGIGRMARDSGLSVSALRFYDSAGALVPAWVDPVSNHRFYGPAQLPEARLPARLRRAGMPLADIRLVPAGWSSADTALVHRLLDAHLRRLGAGLSDARGQLSAIRALLEDREHPMTANRTAPAQFSVPACEPAAALDAVRFAASADADLPMLGGVLFDVEDRALRLVATDRYRPAVAQAPVTGHDGSGVRAVVPSALVDAMRALLADQPAVQLTVDRERVALEAADRRLAGPCIGQGFPDYRRLVRLPAGRRVEVAAAALREAVATGPVRAGEVRAQDGVPFDVTVLTVAEEGAVAVCDEVRGDGRDRVGVNRAFLLEALEAAARDRLVLEFGGPAAPLAVRRTGGDGAFSLLMPVPLEG